MRYGAERGKGRGNLSNTLSGQVLVGRPRGFRLRFLLDVGGNDLVVCNPRGSVLQITSLPRYNQSFTATQFQERRLTPKPGVWDVLMEL